jgi:pyruvate-ferredoxin/flavodoxin oxidoreductase
MRIADRALTNTDPRAAELLLAQAQHVVTEKYRQYEELAGRSGESFHPAGQGFES